MELLIKALPAIISAVCLGLLGWLATKIAGIAREFEVLKESQRQQLKAAIVDKYEVVQERGYITPMSLDTVNRMADSYFKLDGNHYIHALIDRMNNKMEIKGIPIPEGEE